MNKIQELTQVSRTIRENVGLTKEEVFWLQIDLGMEFLRVHFPKDSLTVSNNTNFWDIWVFEWIKDDAKLLKEDWGELDYAGYEILKRGMQDYKILKQLNALLVWKDDTKD
jgi:hypothetical protein